MLASASSVRCIWTIGLLLLLPTAMAVETRVRPQLAGESGQEAALRSLRQDYANALQRAVTAQWVRPSSLPAGQKCGVRVRQVPGGEVTAVEVLPGCVFDEIGKRSLEVAVLRAEPLPYRVFESVFKRELVINFTVPDR